MPVVNAIHKVSDAVDRISSILCVLILTAMVLITGAQIVFRLWFTALTWSEELTRYLLIWSTFIGAGIVYKHAGHISVTIVQGLFPAPVQKGLKLLVHLVCGVFCGMVVWVGFKYMSMQGGQLSAALRIPMRLMYLAIPVGCIIIELHIVDAILQLLVNRDTEVSAS